MKADRPTHVCRVLATGLALYVSALTDGAAAPNPKQWAPAEDLVADCKTDTTKELTFRERGSLPAGTKLGAENFYPEGYTTGDLVMSCKILVAETKAMWREFERAPAAWNDQDRVFEVSHEDYLVQLSGGMPFMRTKVSVFRRAPPSPAAPDPKPRPSARPPARSASK